MVRKKSQKKDNIYSDTLQSFKSTGTPKRNQSNSFKNINQNNSQMNGFKLNKQKQQFQNNKDFHNKTNRDTSLSFKFIRTPKRNYSNSYYNKNQNNSSSPQKVQQINRNSYLGFGSGQKHQSQGKIQFDHSTPQNFQYSDGKQQNERIQQISPQQNIKKCQILCHKGYFKNLMQLLLDQPNNNYRHESQNVYQYKDTKKEDTNNNKPIQQVNKRYIEYDINRRLRVFGVLKDLYNNSSGLRNVEEQYKYYVREIENQSALYKNYNLSFQNKAIVGKICNSYIQVRGDGNCFYTAFGFQYLHHLLCTYSDQEFDEFIKKIQNLQIRFTIQYIKKQIDDKSIEKDLFEEFIYIIEELRQVEKEDRFTKLREVFAQWQINENGDGFLYCLQTLFFRNLSYYFLEQSDLKDVVLDKENLLIWETECNTNEVIIKLLAEQLKIHIKLLFLDNEVILREYEEENNNIIILLIKPGHYNIGWNIPKQ